VKNLNEISIKLVFLIQISIRLVDTKKHNHFKLVYLLLKLILILLVDTASVEWVFSAMNYVKTKRQNKMVMNT
jgi:hypothetical protein